MDAAAVHTAPFSKKHLIYASSLDEGCRLVFSDGSEMRSSETLEEQLNKICLQNGSSLEGRTASFRYIVGNVYKACIMLDERNEAILIPDAPLAKEHAAVILYNDIETVRADGNTCCFIRMKNSMVFDMHLSLRTMHTQMKRCEQYLAQIGTV